MSYSGQTVRNMLISAIKSTISSGGTTAAALTSLFNNDDATATYDGSVVFHDVSTKSVSGKISSDNVVGYDVTPTELITTWFQAAETSGTIKEVLVAVGDEIEIGQLLFKIEAEIMSQEIEEKKENFAQDQLQKFLKI